MEDFKFEDLPLEIFELLSSYLEFYEIAKLEQTSKKILSNVRELKPWRKIAITLIQKYDVPAVKDALNYIKENAATSPRVCKILIGITVHTTKIVNDLDLPGSMRILQDLEAEKLILRNRSILDDDDDDGYLQPLYDEDDDGYLQPLVDGYMPRDKYIKIKCLEFEVPLKKFLLNEISKCYDKAVRTITGNKDERCVEEDMVVETSLDVMCHLDEYRRQTSRFNLSIFQ